MEGQWPLFICSFWKEGKRDVINLFRLGLELRDELTSAFQRCVIPPTKDHDDVDVHVSTVEDISFLAT